MSAPFIHIETTVEASASKAWACYTQAEHITGWNFATDNWTCPYASIDLRRGGKYLARMEARDGSFGFDFEAIIDEIIPEQKLKYTLTDGRAVTVKFTPLNNRIRVEVVFQAETENPAELQRQGWQAILDNYRKYTELH